MPCVYEELNDAAMQATSQRNIAAGAGFRLCVGLDAAQSADPSKRADLRAGSVAEIATSTGEDVLQVGMPAASRPIRGRCEPDQDDERVYYRDCRLLESCTLNESLAGARSRGARMSVLIGSPNRGESALPHRSLLVAKAKSLACAAAGRQAANRESDIRQQ